MNKRRNILFLIAIFLMLAIKAAQAQDPDNQPYSDQGSSIEQTLRRGARVDESIRNAQTSLQQRRDGFRAQVRHALID